MEAVLDFPWAPAGRSGRLAFGEPAEVVAADEPAEVLPALERVAAAAAAGRWAVGFVSYEAGPAFDPAMRVRRGSGMPLVWFGLHDAPLPPGARRKPTAYACSRWQAGTDRPRYAASVAAVREAIARGDSYQVNHTMRLRARFAGDPLGAWADLCRAQRDGWFAYVDTGRHAVASASPELFFRWDGRTLETRPMKGTRGRSPDAAEDARRAEDLRRSPKDRAENLMIVDLLRNDLGRVCVPGTVTVPSLFDVEAYPTVWQLTSTLTGTGRPGLDLPGIFRALFPCGSITGAPKVRTMELIAELEDRPRGVYCGAVGAIFPGGSAAFNVAIRTLVVDGDRARYDVGGGVVWDSDGDDEYAEALAKAAVLDLTQRDFALLETLRVQPGEVVLLERHLARLGASSAWFGRPLDLDDLRRRLLALADRPEAARVRVLVDAAGRATIEVAPLADPWGMPPDRSSGRHYPDPHSPGREDPAPRPVALAAEPVRSADPWLRHKTTRRRVYDAARAAYPQAFDVLLWNERGEATETSIGNLVVELDGALVTPPVSSGLLPGTLRAQLLDTGVIDERVVRVEDLPRAGRLWLVNSVRGWVPISLQQPGPRAR